MEFSNKPEYVSLHDYDTNRFKINSFQIGDHVRYSGGRLIETHTLKRDSVGEIISRVEGEEDTYAVEFGEHTYIIPGERLVRHSFKSKHEGPVIERILKRWHVEED